MSIKKKVLSSGLAFTMLSLCLFSIDNAHFYKVPNLHSQSTTSWSWFDTKKKYSLADWVTKLDVNYVYGATSKGWSKDGAVCNILNSTGPYNMLYLFEGVKLDPSVQNFADFLGRAKIHHEDTNGNFGKLKFHGKFRLNEVNINLKQNLKNGLFLELLVPIREVDIHDIHYRDLSPETGLYNKDTFEWVQFKNSLDTILHNYDLHSYNDSCKQTSFGDISLLLGYQAQWKVKGDDSVKFDLMLKSGVLFPSGKKKDENYIFSLGTGYNGHWAIPVAGQIDAEVVKWLTLSGHGSVVIFLDESEITARMKTFDSEKSELGHKGYFPGQQGYIKLMKGHAKEEEGILWHVGADIKFDHVWKGLSGLVGYSFNQQEKNVLHPRNHDYFTYDYANDDSLLDHWYMHAIHFMIDYDFSVHMQNKKWAPRINIFYNKPVDGHNAFKTSTIGAGLGFDVRWKI